MEVVPVVVPTVVPLEHWTEFRPPVTGDITHTSETPGGHRAVDYWSRQPKDPYLPRLPLVSLLGSPDETFGWLQPHWFSTPNR